MPMHYKIDSERGMLFIVAEGETTQAERFEAMQAWMGDPEFRPGLQTPKRIAIVTARPESFGVARQFGALAPGAFLTVRVFKDRKSALAWLAEDSSMPSPSQ